MDDWPRLKRELWYIILKTEVHVAIHRNLFRTSNKTTSMPVKRTDLLKLYNEFICRESAIHRNTLYKEPEEFISIAVKVHITKVHITTTVP
jgi:hypothetical protein